MLTSLERVQDSSSGLMHPQSQLSFAASALLSGLGPLTGLGVGWLQAGLGWPQMAYLMAQSPIWALLTGTPPASG